MRGGGVGGGSDLRGTSLRIGDKIVIDQNANIITSNIYCGHVLASITTPCITELKSMEGILIAGNVAIPTGHSLTLDTIRSSHGVLSLVGDFRVGDAVLARSISAPNGRIHDLIVDGIVAENGTSVTIDGDVTLTGPSRSFRGALSTDRVCALSGRGVTLTGGLSLDRLSVTKSVSEPSHTNVVATNASAGLVYLSTKAPLSSGATASVRIISDAIVPSSLIIAVIGKYVGQGVPVVQSSVPALGSAEIHITNVHPILCISSNTLIPIQYIIV